jgi:tetratricopeptide (TPR) repeat protein
MAAAGDAVGLANRLTGVTNRLLANLDGLDPAFDEWLGLQRAAIDNQIMAEAMACASAALTTAPKDSLRLAQAIWARDPLDEAVARLAMTAAHAAGETGEMHRIWRRLEEDLKRELDAQPSAETAACFAELQTAPAAGSRQAAPGPNTPTPLPPPPRRPWVLAGAGLTVALAALLAWLWTGHQPPEPGSVRVERLQSPAGDAQAALFADELAGDVAKTAQARRSTLRISGPGAGTSSRFVVDGHVRSVSGQLNAILELHLASDGPIIWSTSSEEPLAAAANMRRQAALKLVNVLTCTVGDGDREFKDIEVLKLFLAACEGMDYGTGSPNGSGSVRDLFRKIVARAPNFARAWANLAVGDAIHTLGGPDSPEAFAAGRKLTEQDAARALALDPRQSRAWVARAMVADGLNEWLRRDADISRALAIDPNETFALVARSDALAEIGRNRDSLAVAQQTVNSDEFLPEQWGDLAQSMAYAGVLTRAYVTLDEAEKRWPGNPDVAISRLFITARIGDPATAQRLLDDFSTGGLLEPAKREYLRLLIAARADPTQAEKLVAYILAHVDQDLNFNDAAQGLVGVGKVDLALDLVQNNISQIARHKHLTDGFFRPFMAKFLASPRFMPLAARIGFVDIWRRSGLWPDFCTAPDAPYDCKAEARKLAKS